MWTNVKVGKDMSHSDSWNTNKRPNAYAYSNTKNTDVSLRQNKKERGQKNLITRQEPFKRYHGYTIERYVLF